MKNYRKKSTFEFIQIYIPSTRPADCTRYNGDSIFAREMVTLCKKIATCEKRTNVTKINSETNFSCLKSRYSKSTTATQRYKNKQQRRDDKISLN